MRQDVNLEIGSVQETMLIPLWGRAKFSRLYPEFINDLEAEKIIDDLDYDFTNICDAMGEYGGIAYLVRASRFDDAIRNYVARHPQTTVVNLGAGLDTTFSRVDNGRIRWFDLDVSDSIALRRELIPETKRSTYIERSAFDLEWLKEVEFEPEKGIFIFAGGLFMYFKTWQVRDLMVAIANRFPGGELQFDALSRLGRSFINAKLKRVGTPIMHFSVSNSHQLFPKWSPKIEVVEDVPVWLGISRDPRWGKGTVMMMNMCDWLRTGKIIKLRIMQ